MSGASRVVWSEGMFLRTQHFQQQDRYTDRLIRETLWSRAEPSYGFRSLKIDETALGAGRFVVTEAMGVFPDGTLFTIPNESVGVPPQQFPQSLEPGIIHLAIAAESVGATNIDLSHAKPSGARFRGQLQDLRDSTDMSASPETIEVAKLAPKLLLPGMEIEGYTSLPVARFVGLDQDGGIELDPMFLPPCLTISALPFYGQLAKEVTTGLTSIADAHAPVVLGGTGASVENLLILELANAVRPRMAHISSLGEMHPSDFFAELAGLAGQMSTYSSSRRLMDLPLYDHTNPQAAIEALTDTLRSLILSLRHVEKRARALQVSRHSDNVWTVRIDNPEIIRSSRVVIRVGGDMSEAYLRKLFVEQATVGPANTFDDLWTSRLTGIPLKPLHSQPREIPYDGDRLCLELDRSSPHWAEVMDTQGFVLGVSGKLEREPEIDCYAIQR